MKSYYHTFKTCDGHAHNKTNRRIVELEENRDGSVYPS